MRQARKPDVGNKMIARIIGIKGICSAGHEIGDTFPLSCRYPGQLCGYFFHDIFPNISVIQHGGGYPWWQEGQRTFEYYCPDHVNQVSLVVEVQED